MRQQNTNPDHNIPGEELVYERANGIVYARYTNPELRHIKRWIIGGDNRIRPMSGDMMHKQAAEVRLLINNHEPNAHSDSHR